LRWIFDSRQVLDLFCTACTHTLFINRMNTLPTRTAAVVALMGPVYGIVLVLAFLGKGPRPPRSWAEPSSWPPRQRFPCGRLRGKAFLEPGVYEPLDLDGRFAVVQNPI